MPLLPCFYSELCKRCPIGCIAPLEGYANGLGGLLFHLWEHMGVGI